MPLNIDIGGDASGFANAMAKAQALAELGMDSMKKKFGAAGEEIKAKWLSSMSEMGKGMAVRLGVLGAAAAGAVAAFAVVAHGIKQANEALEQYIGLQKDADAAGAPVEAYQRWMELTNKLRVETTDLEAAIKAAFAAVREGTLGESSKFFKQASEIITNQRGEGGASAFRAYVLSQNDEQRIRAGIDMVKEFLELGNRQSAGALAETLLGKDFADKIMSGRVPIEQLAAEIDKIAANKEIEIITQAQINNAVDISNRIAEAKDQLDKALGISKFLSEEGQIFKEQWAVILESILAATKGLQSFFSGLTAGIVNASAAASKAADEIELKVSRERASTLSGTMLDREMKRIARLEDSLGIKKLAPEGGGPGLEDARIPFTTAGGLPHQMDRPPIRPPIDVSEKNTKAKAAKDTSESLDQVERFIIQQQRANEILKAEAAAYGQSNTVKEQGIALARATAAARLAERDLTEDETQKIKANAAARAELIDKMEKQKDLTKLQHFFGEQLVSSLEKMTEKGAKFADIMADVGKAIQRAAIQALILGEGPLASLFGTKGVGGASGGLIGILSKAFAGSFADGGIVPGVGPKLAVVHGGETIIPPKMATGGIGSGGITLAITQSVDARGSQIGVADQIAAALDANNRALRVQLPSMIRDARSRSTLV
jgi:hypothetical protein